MGTGRDPLALLLEECAQQAIKRIDRRTDIHSQFLAVPIEIYAPFADALKADAGISRILDVFVRMGSTGSILQGALAAPILIHRAATQPADTIIERLRAIADGDGCAICYVCTLGGIRPQGRLTLAADTELVPIELAPPRWEPSGSVHWPDRHPTPEMPTAALLVRSHLIPRLGEPPQGFERFWDPRDQALNAIAGLALTTKAAPRMIGEYEFVEDLGWPGHANMGGSYHTPPYPPVLGIELEVRDEASRATAAWSSACSDKALQRALEKLLDARRRFLDVERAMDLGSCLEILLMHGEGESSEIAYKIRVRAAWLAGNHLDERRRIYEVAKSAYNLRSKAIHEGRLPKSRTPDAHNAMARTLADADDLCAKLISRVVERGWPNWADIVLDADSI